MELNYLDIEMQSNLRWDIQPKSAETQKGESLLTPPFAYYI